MLTDDFDSKCILRHNEINIEKELYNKSISNISDSYDIKEECIIIHKRNKKEEDVTNVD